MPSGEFSCFEREYCTHTGAVFLCRPLIIRSNFVLKLVQKGALGSMNAAIEKKIGSNIRTLREQAGLTQDQLSAKLQVNGCDITRSALAKIEVGQRHIYPDELMLIRQILNVSYERLFQMTESR